MSFWRNRCALPVAREPVVGPFAHHTFSPLASTSLNCSAFGGASPRTSSANSKRAGILDRQRPSRADVAGDAAEVEVDAQGAAVRSGHGSQRGLDVVAGREPPGGRIGEVVEQHVLGLRLRLPSPSPIPPPSRSPAPAASFRHPLTLPASRPCHVLALQGEKEQQHRQHGDHRAGHHQLVVLHVLAREAGQRHRQACAASRR